MTKPQVILDTHWRRLNELFSDADLKRLQSVYDIIWGQDTPMPKAQLMTALQTATAYVSAPPHMDKDRLQHCKNLQVIAEVAGAFPDTIDYQACADKGVEILCCAPGFRQSVAEMALAMILGACRGLVQQDRCFRNSTESWLEDFTDRDFSLFDTSVGFVGYGQIARETHRLMFPFSPTVRVYDPYLSADMAEKWGVESISLHSVLQQSQVLMIAAAPTNQNKGMIGKKQLTMMPKGALLVLISRAHLVDFDALKQVVDSGHIQATIDVFPQEPLSTSDSLRQAENVILSPHRAAAVANGRQLIGKLLTDDLIAIASGDTTRQLQQAKHSQITNIAGVGDAVQMANIAENRQS